MQHLFRPTKAACEVYVPYNGARITFSMQINN